MKKIIYSYKTEEDFLPRLGLFAIVENDELAQELVDSLNNRNNFIFSNYADKRNFKAIDLEILNDEQVRAEIEEYNQRRYLDVKATMWCLGNENPEWFLSIVTQESETPIETPLFKKEDKFIEIIFTEHEKDIPNISRDSIRKYFSERVKSVLKQHNIVIDKFTEVY